MIESNFILIIAYQININQKLKIMKNQKSEISKKEIASKLNNQNAIIDANQNELDQISKNLESLLIESPKRSSNKGNSLYLFNPLLSPKFNDLKDFNDLSDKDIKSYRSSMRSKLNGFINDLLGKDRSMEDRIDAKNRFNAFFEINYQSNDLKSISDIYQGNDLSKMQLIQSFIDGLKIINEIK